MVSKVLIIWKQTVRGIDTLGWGSTNGHLRTGPVSLVAVFHGPIASYPFLMLPDFYKRVTVKGVGDTQAPLWLHGLLRALTMRLPS
eukprot:COSAG05_NODE_1201_length_5537_cov_9.015447_5_plen_86_part_00